MVRACPIVVIGLLLCSAGPVGCHTDSQLGYSIDVPPGWQAVTVPQTRPGLTTKAWVAPGGKASLSVTVLALPEAAPPRKFVLSDEAASRQLKPDAYKLISQGEVKVNGLEGYGSVSQFQLPTGLVQRRRAYFDSGGTLYLVIGDAAPADYATYQAAFEAAVKSFRLTTGRQPSGYTSIAGDTYGDDRLGFSVAAPGAGWFLYTTKPPVANADLLLVVCGPDGMCSTCVLVMPRPGQLTAAQIAQGDLNQLKRTDPHATSQGPSATRVDGQAAQAFVAEFSINAVKRKRWAVYCVKGEKLYAVISDAIPPQSYDAYKDAFAEVVASLKLK